MITKTQHMAPFIYGPGASLRVGKIAKELGVSKAIVIYDIGVKTAGVVDPILENLTNAGIEYVLFDGVKADPPDYTVNEAGEIASAAKINGIIAVGGGSSMDTAKGVNALLNNPPPINQWFAPAIPPNPGAPLILVPTSAGTGSECTAGAVITDTKLNKKGGLASPVHCYSSMSIIDPELYAGMPPKPTAFCAFDAYSHSFDAICHTNHEPVGEMFAKESIRLIHKYLLTAIKDGKNIEVRGAIALAATFGGYAINSSMCHVTHMVGHTLGSAFHLPHGYGCAVCMPQIARLYAKWIPERLKIVAECMGLKLPENISNEQLGETMHDELLKFMKQCGFQTLKELGYSKEEVMALVPMVSKDVAAAFAPCPLSLSQISAMLDEAYDL